jgi:hypothetical protein
VGASLTWLARWQIKRRGGQLWVWETPVGESGIGLIRTANSAPFGLDFAAVETNGLRLWFKRDFPLTEVTIGWTPITGFAVTGAGTFATQNWG